MNSVPQGYMYYLPGAIHPAFGASAGAGAGTVPGANNYGYGSAINQGMSGFQDQSICNTYYMGSNSIVAEQNQNNAQPVTTEVVVDGGSTISHLAAGSAQQNKNEIQPSITEAAENAKILNLESNAETSNHSQDQPQAPVQLVKFSEMVLKNSPFFFDLPIFIISVEEIYKILNNDRKEDEEMPILTGPGPSGMLDLYQLYCQHVAGDPHIVRTIESIINVSIKNQIPAALSYQELLQTAKRKAACFGQKRGAKLYNFYKLYSVPGALDQPFVCGESNVRHHLCTIWYRQWGTGPLRKKRMCQLYKQYCLHIENNEKFFHGIFGLTVILPHGPFKLSHLENLVIILKSIPFKRPLKLNENKDLYKDSDGDSDEDYPTEFDILSNNDMSVVLYIRQDLGVDHQLYQNLSPTLRYIIGNHPVTIAVPKLSRRTQTQTSSSNIEFMQFCSSSPASSNDINRIQLKFPSDLTVPEYKQVFSWVFESTEIPGIFVIRNEQWNEYLMVQDNASDKRENENRDGGFEFCQLTTSTDYKDESNRTKFSLVIQGHDVHISSCFTNSPIVIDGRLKRPLVPKKVASPKSSDSDDLDFGLGTQFFVTLA